MTLRAALVGILASVLLAASSHSPTSFADDKAATPAPDENPPEAKNKEKIPHSKLTIDESEYQSDRRHLRLTTGEDKAVDLEFDVANANGISIGNPQVLATTLVKVGDKRQIVFKPLKAGETTVTVRDSDGTMKVIFVVRVTGSNLLRVAGEIRDLLRDVEGIDIRVVGPKVVIEGEALVPGDYGRMLTVISDKAYSDLVLNLTTLSPLAMQVLARRIQEDVDTFAPNVRTRVVNGIIFLEGTVDNIDQANRAAKVASLYLPDLRPGSPLEKDVTVQRLGTPRSLIQNFIVVNPPPPKKSEKLVRVTVYFVELSKDYNKFFGFKWEPGFTADPQIAIGTNQQGQTSATNGASFSATISSLIPKLQTAQQAGYARVLRTGTFVVKSGQPAVLSEQTQFPYTQQGANGQTVAASQAIGLEVAATPRVLGQSEDIDLDLKLNQIDLVGTAPASGGAPVTSNHKVETKVYVKSNESAAVAGVISSDIGTDFNKADPNSSLFSPGTDPLFTLLHTKAYRKKKSQFVIFVTPQIIESASEGTEDLKKNFRVRVK